MPAAVVFQSVLTCPRCGFSKEETMPMDACQFFYECGGCKALVRPKPGNCYMRRISPKDAPHSAAKVTHLYQSKRPTRKTQTNANYP